MSYEGARSEPQMAIVGMGNLLLRDEGIGIHLIEALKEAYPHEASGLELIDGGTALPPLPQGLDKLIIVDAAQGGEEPGTIYRFTPEDIAGGESIVLSAHQLGLWESLRLMELENSKPKSIIIFGVEPKTVGWGVELSPEVERKLPQLIGLVLQEAGAK